MELLCGRNTTDFMHSSSVQPAKETYFISRNENHLDVAKL
jgi:hypothetical protein